MGLSDALFGFQSPSLRGFCFFVQPGRNGQPKAIPFQSPSLRGFCFFSLSRLPSSSVASACGWRSAPLTGLPAPFCDSGEWDVS
ncbi:MAG: hypothetical protein RMJ55_18405 [Roseiflexaceae bacterium]|nr:hypothetical protein [Roseiflexaceae bacterium]